MWALAFKRQGWKSINRLGAAGILRGFLRNPALEAKGSLDVAKLTETVKQSRGEPVANVLRQREVGAVWLEGA